MEKEDLNVFNYNYNDLLNIFKIENSFNSLPKQKMDDTLLLIKNNCADNYYDFYLKAYKIILSIFDLYYARVISLANDPIIDIYVNKIKLIPSFEKYEIPKIIEILNSETELPSRIPEQIKTNNVEDTYPNKIAPGYLNPIKNISQLQNLNLNSCFRHNYYNSSPCDFKYSIPGEIKNVVSMRLASIEIPHAWYLFSSVKKNNTFEIDIINGDIITTYQITVPDGNYDSDSLQTYLNTTYFYESATSSDLINIEFSIDQYSFKSKIKMLDSTLGFTVRFMNDINANMMMTFGWLIGFRLASYKNFNTEIISEGLFDGGGDSYIYVAINDYQYNTNSLNIIGFDDSIMEKNIIAKISMYNGKLSLIVEDNNNPLIKKRRYNGPVNLRQLHIQLLDKFGAILDLNNMDWSFTLELELLYEGFNFKNINS